MNYSFVKRLQTICIHKFKYKNVHVFSTKLKRGSNSYTFSLFVKLYINGCFPGANKKFPGVKKNYFPAHILACLNFKTYFLQFDTTLCDKVCQSLVAGLWFSPPKRTDRWDITEILLKVSLNTITLTLTHYKIQLKL